jgi:hypothetical protein
MLATALGQSFHALASRAVALTLARPDEARRILEWLDPAAADRLFLELLRIARGKVAARLMSSDLRSVLQSLTACLEVTQGEPPAAPPP